MRVILLSTLVLTWASSCWSFEAYKARIPNGNKVPDPCHSGQMWGGVGHVAPEGGGKRNAFGAAFHTAGLAWTADLCNEDSDGDGLTNGVELCDPGCNWQEEDDDPACSGSNSVSHPGLHNDNYQC